MFRRRSLVARLMRKTVLVHRTEGRPSIRGVLVDEERGEGGWLALRHAVVLLEPERRGEDAPPPVPLAGDAFVPAGSIDFVQDPREAEFTQHRAPRRAVASASSWDHAPVDPRPLRSA